VHLLEAFGDAFGIGVRGDDMPPAPMALRALVIYAAALLVVRLGNRRFMARATAFDMVVAIMLGSVLSRAITGHAGLASALSAAAALVLMHGVLALLALRSPFLGRWIKGTDAREVIRDGEPLRDVMRKEALSERDLEEALRGAGKEDPSQVKRAFVERNGDVSVIAAEPAPRVVEVKVEAGVQTVRVQLA
jgi:uncharacterized membrane protein YcaP (DUF421 family)